MTRESWEERVFFLFQDNNNAAFPPCFSFSFFCSLRFPVFFFPPTPTRHTPIFYSASHYAHTNTNIRLREREREKERQGEKE